MQDAASAYGLDPDNITVFGYSNGANFAAAVASIYPGLIRRAILLRPLMPLDDSPQVDLSGLELLTIAGADDPYGRFAQRLNHWALDSGAQLDAHQIEGGHGLTREDFAIARNWLDKVRKERCND